MSVTECTCTAETGCGEGEAAGCDYCRTVLDIYDPCPREIDHEFSPVDGHPDDDECTHRSDGTDSTYCGRPKAEHEDASGVVL